MKKALIEFEIDGEKFSETICIDGMGLEETFKFINLFVFAFGVKERGKVKLISIIFFEDTTT